METSCFPQPRIHRVRRFIVIDHARSRLSQVWTILHLLRSALALHHEVRLEGEIDHENFIALLYEGGHRHLNVQGNVRGAALQRVETDKAVPDALVGPTGREGGERKKDCKIN